MHIPDGILDPATLITLWIVTILVMILGYFKMGKVFEKEDSEKFYRLPETAHQCRKFDPRNKLNSHRGI